MSFDNRRLNWVMAIVFGTMLLGVLFVPAPQSGQRQFNVKPSESRKPATQSTTD